MIQASQASVRLVHFPNVRLATRMDSKPPRVALGQLIPLRIVACVKNDCYVGAKKDYFEE